MKKDGYFESKRLKLPRTSTTAELHRPLTLSESIRILNRRAFHINVPIISRIHTDADRETTNVHTNLPKKKRKKKKKKAKKVYDISTPLYDESIPYLSPLLPERGESLVTPCQTQTPNRAFQPKTYETVEFAF